MSISKGSVNLGKVYAGPAEVGKIYIGNNLVYQATEPIDPILNNNDWETISAVSQRGEAENYWSVGDTKQITLNGTIGDTPFNNVQLDVFILGFNHNESIEGAGITFCGFFHDPKAIALSSIHGANPSTNGAKWFNINHSGESTTGGWKGCDMRYDILGSVEKKNQQNATSVAKTNPVANTLMAALPADFRSVIKPITKWTDNVGGGSGNLSSNVTSTVDYIPLLAEYEVYGTRTYANSYEASKQKQYEYFKNKTKLRYAHDNFSNTLAWYQRSCYYNNNSGWCADNGNQIFCLLGSWSCGVVPIFLV